MILYHYTTAAGLHDIVARSTVVAPRSEISHRLPERRSHSFVNIAEKFMASSDSDI